jgi:hypothetical protein
VHVCDLAHGGVARAGGVDEHDSGDGAGGLCVDDERKRDVDFDYRRGVGQRERDGDLHRDGEPDDHGAQHDDDDRGADC